MHPPHCHACIEIQVANPGTKTSSTSLAKVGFPESAGHSGLVVIPLFLPQLRELLDVSKWREGTNNIQTLGEKKMSSWKHLKTYRFKDTQFPSPENVNVMYKNPRVPWVAVGLHRKWGKRCNQNISITSNPRVDFESQDLSRIFAYHNRGDIYTTTSKPRSQLLTKPGPTCAISSNAAKIILWSIWVNYTNMINYESL